MEVSNQLELGSRVSIIYLAFVGRNLGMMPEPFCGLCGLDSLWIRFLVSFSVIGVELIKEISNHMGIKAGIFLI